MKNKIENFFIKHWHWMVLLISAAAYFIFKRWEYPFWDSLFIAISIGFSLLVSREIIRKSEGRNVEVMVMLLLGILALQAAWPIFMPRISLEDINQVKGIYYADKNQHQMIQEAVIRVKPPLFPLIMNRDYPIANNLTVLQYEYSSPNLEILDNHNGRDIKIALDRITGWSFDEITGRIFYQAEKPFLLPSIFYSGEKNIGSIYKIPKSQDYELYPYNYGYSFPIENQNNFPIEIYDISFSIYNNTEAWTDLKKWIDSGYCASPIYSWSNGSSAGAEVNGKPTLISGKMFSSTNISLQIHYIPLAPHETKFPNIIFKEIVCGDAVKDKPSYTSYNITGTVTFYKVIPQREDANYFIILIRNINTAKLGSTYAFPNTPYKYDLASLPGGYIQGDFIQINVCENVQNCTASKNITVDMVKGSDEVNFNIQ